MMQTRDNKRARLLPSAAFDALGNDLLIRCASYLDADGMAQLGRTSSRFGIPRAGQQRSLTNEAARQQLQSATDEEKNCLTTDEDESDIGFYRALELLRQPLRFNELVGIGFHPQEHPSSVTCTGPGSIPGPGTSIIRYLIAFNAMSKHVMRSGRHFVEFTITNDGQEFPGIRPRVTRPVSLTNGFDLEADWKGYADPAIVSSRYKPAASRKLRSLITSKWGDSNVHSYSSGDGSCIWTDWNTYDISDWQGREGLRESWAGSGKIGLLLDLNEGTLSVFMNGRRLGVMKDGLGGEYCWFVSVYSACTISMSKSQVPNSS